MDTITLKKIGVFIVITIIYVIVCRRVYHHLENKCELFYDNVKSKKKSKIYDIIHHNLPSMRNLSILVDVIPYLILTVVLFIDVNLFHSVIGFLATVFIIRIFVIHLTVLPKDKKCDIKNTSLCSGGCYDKIYSGHFSVVFMCLLVLYTNKYINLFTLTSLSALFTILITTARLHYTIDIFVAFLVVIIIYQNNMNFNRVIDALFRT